MTANQNPEQKARDTIDDLLTQAGWSVQHSNKMDLNAGVGQAVREYQTDAGPADYVLFVNRKAVGVIEAKRAGTRPFSKGRMEDERGLALWSLIIGC